MNEPKNLREAAAAACMMLTMVVGIFGGGNSPIILLLIPEFIAFAWFQDMVNIQAVRGH